MSASNSSNKPGSVGRSMKLQRCSMCERYSRFYVDAVNAAVRSDTTAIGSDVIERWSKWARAEADRIDPVKTARFLDGMRTDDDAK